MAEHPRDFLEKNVTLPNGLKVHYYEWPGPRPNLVLLHPSSGYGRMWEATAVRCCRGRADRGRTRGSASPAPRPGPPTSVHSPTTGEAARGSAVGRATRRRGSAGRWGV